MTQSDRIYLTFPVSILVRIFNPKRFRNLKNKKKAIEESIDHIQAENLNIVEIIKAVRYVKYLRNERAKNGEDKDFLN